MKRRRIIGVILAGIVMLAGCVVYGRVQQPADGVLEYAQWSPDPAAIRSTIGNAAAPTQGMTDADRRQQFCLMFKNRFRKHEPAVAVGLRFLSPTRIKLMCPARMEPFLIDQIALTLWHEARDNFGKPIDIDIYDTFIGTTQIQIGKLRAQAAHPEVADISYDYTTLINMARPRPPLPMSSARMPAIKQGFAPLSQLNMGR